jgi:hypothetical protein
VAAARLAAGADILPPMLVLAISEAAKTTIVYIALWFVLLPALVTGLIVFAVIQARGEKAAYEEIRRSRRR